MDDQAMQERYRALLLAARNLFSLTSLDDLVENILKYSRVMMQAEACSMFLPDRATQELIIYSARGRDDAINAFRILPEAEYWMERELKVKLAWDDGKTTTQHFYQLVKRRFS